MAGVRRIVACRDVRRSAAITSSRRKSPSSHGEHNISLLVFDSINCNLDISLASRLYDEVEHACRCEGRCQATARTTP